MNDVTSILQSVVVPIIVALITATGGLIAVLKSNGKIRKQNEEFRVENTEQHEVNKSALHESQTLLRHLSTQVTGIDSKVDKLDERLDNVQTWQSEHEKFHIQNDNPDQIL